MGKRIILFCANLFWLCSCATTTGMTPEETSVSEEARYIVQIVGGREEFYKQGKIAVILDPQVRSQSMKSSRITLKSNRGINGSDGKNSCFRQMDRPYPRKKFERKGC